MAAEQSDWDVIEVDRRFAQLPLRNAVRSCQLPRHAWVPRCTYTEKHLLLRRRLSMEPPVTTKTCAHFRKVRSQSPRRI